MHHAVWWQVYPLGFVGAEPENPGGHAEVQHRLGAISDWLDTRSSSAPAGWLLGPVFESESHGYDTVDYFRVDPRLGDDADFGP